MRENNTEHSNQNQTPAATSVTDLKQSQQQQQPEAICSLPYVGAEELKVGVHCVLVVLIHTQEPARSHSNRIRLQVVDHVPVPLRFSTKEHDQ
jgi:hypothetical protein